MRIEMFNVGWISSSAAVWRQGEDPERRIRFPVPAYLVETDRERILIDTGLHPAAVQDPQAHYERPEAGLFELEQAADITAQLDLETLTSLAAPRSRAHTRRQKPRLRGRASGRGAARSPARARPSPRAAARRRSGGRGRRSRAR